MSNDFGISIISVFLFRVNSYARCVLLSFAFEGCVEELEGRIICQWQMQFIGHFNNAILLLFV